MAEAGPGSDDSADDVLPWTSETQGTRGNVMPWTSESQGTRSDVMAVTSETQGTRGNVMPWTSETQGTRGNIEVHNHLHMHDRRLFNRGTIGHVSTGDDNRGDTRFGTANQELVNQLEQNTLARITSWTAGMVKTAALHLLLSMIASGSHWVTIRGSPGEGKTTLAYQALVELRGAGKRMFQVWKPEELSSVLQECPQSAVVMLDDMFGSLAFDLDNWKKWEVELQKILGETEHHSLEQSRKIKNDVIVIVVGRDYVFNSATCNLGKYSQFFTEAKHVINMTASYKRDVQEKMSIWKTLSEAGGVELETKTVETICNIDCPHGFPHVCRLFITMCKEDKNLNAEMFFQSPIEFLNQTVAKFMENDDLFEVFRELIVGDGKVSVGQLGQLVRSRRIIKAADDLVGSYLRKENFVYEFDHPSILDSVAFHFCNSHLDIVIQKCPMSFLHERVRLKPSRGTPSNENSLVVYIPRSFITDLVQRFATEVSNRHFSKVLSHKAMTDVEFVKEFISSLPDPHKLMYETDVNFDRSDFGWKLINFECDLICINEGTFLYYIPSSQSPLLLEHIERHTKTQLSTRDIETVLAGACRFAATDVVTYLMRRHNIDINMLPGDSKQTPLMIAAKSGDSGFVDTILDMKPDVTVKDRLGHTALHRLCYNGVVSAVSRVIDMGCDVNDKAECGRSPLREACRGQKTAVVKALLDSGASVDGGAVHLACERGNLDIVTLLFTRGATLDIKTSVHSACYGRSVKVIEYLIGKGASVNISDLLHDTPLNIACWDGWYQGVQWLLEHGADIHSRGRSGRTPLHEAADSGSHECVEMFLSAKANVNIQDEKGRTPLHEAADSGSRECVEMLLSAKANVNIQDEKGSTPLHEAVERGSHECVEILLSAKANVNIQDEKGSTPLHKAAWSGSHECVEMLLKSGADTRIMNDDGRTSLHEAVVVKKNSFQYYHYLPVISVCETLITHGVDVNSMDKEGNTALHLLCQVQSDTKIFRNWPLQPASYFADEYRSLVKMFVDYGSDTQKLNTKGEPALRGWCRQLLTKKCDQK